MADIVTRVLVVGLLWGISYSLPLWLSATRDYPLAPILSWWPHFEKPLDLIAPGLLTVAAIARLCTARFAPLTNLTIVVTGLALAIEDQTRWQPWFYQYLVMILILTTSAKRPDRALDGCRLVLSFTYFWSGIQKLNITFCTSLVPWLFTTTPDAGKIAGIACALLEALMGIALLVPPLRRIAVILIAIMHFQLMHLLYRHDWNSVVWPWNFVMPILCLLLFWKCSANGTRILLPNSIGKTLAIVLFGILPSLNFAGYWDTYLSAALYSGNTPRGILRLTANQWKRLPEKVRLLAVYEGADLYELEVLQWSIGSTNVACYPEVRVYRQIAREALKQLGGDTIVLRIRRYPRWFEALPEDQATVDEVIH